MKYPYLQETRAERQTTQVFKGINRTPKAGDGEFYDEQNLSSSAFPCMAPRARRGTVKELINPQALGGNTDGLAYVANNRLYYKDVDTGLTLTNAPDKRIVAFGAYLLVLPDNMYYNTVDPDDKGSMGAEFTTTGSITYTMTRDDGTDYDTASIPNQATLPENPENGDYWINTSESPHMLMQYSGYSEAWTSILSVYTKIAATGIGSQFREQDAVEISGCNYTGSNTGVQNQISALNGPHILHAAGNNYVIVTGLLDEVYTQATGSVTIKREIPVMDHVCVSGNRLWGCRYGENLNGAVVNEIYASKLGDFRNFGSFAGISTDSYAVTVGQPGPFTGAVSHLGYLLFFKEDCLYKVFGSQPRNYQVNDTICAGVMNGSDQSMVIVNHTLYYLSRDGEIVSYDGAMPTPVFDALAGKRFTDGVAGMLNKILYVSLKDAQGDYHLFTYNSRLHQWHREDGIRPLALHYHEGELYALADGALLSMTGKQGAKEADIVWSATTGMIGWEIPNQKYISRFNFRVEMPPASSVLLEIQYDSRGEWQNCGRKTMQSSGTGTFMLPVRPRRCDHFRLRLSGTGHVVLHSVDRKLETGGDGRAVL